MFRQERKELTVKLIGMCEEEGVKIPTDGKVAMVEAGTMLMAHRSEDGYHLGKSLEALKEKFGLKKNGKKRRAGQEKSDDAEKGKESDENEDSPKKATAKKRRSEASKAAIEENQDLVDIFNEIGGYLFKEGNRGKAFAFKKVAGAIRDTDTKIMSGAQAMKLKGVGKSSGAKIDEFLETGSVAALEEFRKGQI